MCLAETTDAVHHHHDHEHQPEHDHRHDHDHDHEPHERLGRRRFLMGGGALAAGTALSVTGPSLPAGGSRLGTSLSRSSTSDRRPHPSAA